MLLDPQVVQFLKQLGAVSPGLSSVWLVGSRANGTARPTSDWDFLAFGSEETLTFLQSATALHRQETDFLVVTNGEDFQAAWGEPQKTGSLSEWQWSQLTATDAEYMQSKWVEHEDGSGVKVSQSRATRVWPF